MYSISIPMLKSEIFILVTLFRLSVVALFTLVIIRISTKKATPRHKKNEILFINKINGLDGFWKKKTQKNLGRTPEGAKLYRKKRRAFG